MIKKIINFLEKILRTDVRYVLRGYFWFAIEHSVSILTGIVTSVAYANLIPAETYGLFRYAISIMPFLGIATLEKMNDSLAVSVARGFEGDTLRILKIKMKFGLLGTLGGIGLAVYYYYNNDVTISLLVLAMSLFIPIFNPPLLYASYLTGKKKFPVLSILNSASMIIYSAVIVVAILLSKNVFVVLISYFLINVTIRFVVMVCVLRKNPPNNLTESQTMDYGKKINLLEIVNIASSALDNILVFHYLGAAELAAYAFIKKVPENLKFIPRFLTILSMPKFSKKDIGDPKIKKEVVRKTWIFYSGISVLVFIYILSAPFVFNLLFKPYKQYVIYSQIYALSFAFNFGGLFLSFVEANRKTKKVLSLHFTTSIVGILIMFLSLRFYGLLGLVSGYSVNRLFASIMRYVYFKTAKS